MFLVESLCRNTSERHVTLATCPALQTRYSLTNSPHSDIVHRALVAQKRLSTPGKGAQVGVVQGSRMVRELFVMAREHAPSIIFMDEVGPA